MRIANAAPKSPRSPPSRRKSERREYGTKLRTLKARSHAADTTLQRHVSFFDDNGNRRVNFAECARGLKALGVPFGIAELAALAIVVPLSIQTGGSLLALDINIDNIQRGRHDSDTGILDKRGRFSARRFEKVFGACATADRNGDKAFTASELTGMIHANRESLLGSLVSTVEWQVLLALAADTDAVECGKTVPALSVGRIKWFYDGTLFYKLANDRAQGHGEVFGQSIMAIGRVIQSGG